VLWFAACRPSRRSRGMPTSRGRNNIRYLCCKILAGTMLTRLGCAAVVTTGPFDRRFYRDEAVLVQPAECTRLLRALVRLRNVNFSLYLKDADTSLERERPTLGKFGYGSGTNALPSRRRARLTSRGHCCSGPATDKHEHGARSPRWGSGSEPLLLVLPPNVAPAG